MSSPDSSDSAFPEEARQASADSGAAASSQAVPADDAQHERRLVLDCWYLTGATASGKSAVSLNLANRLDAEIISLDSMAVYREMNIGTAKPSQEAQQAVPHHLIDILDPTERFSVSEYRAAALQKMDEIAARGRKVLVVGGSALYLKALLRGLFPGPPADWELRKRIESEMADWDETELHKRLQFVDPVAAHKLHVNDRRRIIRALEVYYQTGTPISHWQMEFDQAVAPDQCRVFTLRHPRRILHQRIERRVHDMFERGLIEEVSALLSRGNNSALRLHRPWVTVRSSNIYAVNVTAKRRWRKC